MLAIAIAYVVLISTWAFTLLITIYKSGEDPLYHNDTFLMTKALAIVWISGAVGFAGSMILGEFPTFMIYRFVLISVVTSVCTTSGLFVLIYPKYASIYLNPEENIIFPGKFYQQQVMENNKMRFALFVANCESFLKFPTPNEVFIRCLFNSFFKFASCSASCAELAAAELIRACI